MYNSIVSSIFSDITKINQNKINRGVVWGKKMSAQNSLKFLNCKTEKWEVREVYNKFSH